MTLHTTSESLLAAMDKFDAELRGTDKWANWEKNGNFDYAIQHGGRLYPVKEIVAAATGAPTTQFSGGVNGANRVVEANGFNIIQLRHGNNGDTLSRMLALFKRLRTERDAATWPESTYQRAPNKPILLLAVLDGLADGSIHTREVMLDDRLRSRFQTYWAATFPERPTPNILTPFEHLENDGVWKVEAPPEPTGIRRATLENNLFELGSRGPERQKLRDALIQTYFREDLRLELEQLSADSQSEVRGDSIKLLFEKILGDYARIAPGQPWGREDPLWKVFEELTRRLRALAPIKKRQPHLQVSWSAGLGRKAAIPWIALMDSRETTSTQEGVYCVFLIREDLSGFYLTLAQGVTKPRRDYPIAAEYETFVRDKVAKLRRLAARLESRDFHLDGRIDLRGSRQLARDYEGATAAYKFYAAESIPSDAELEPDLETVLTAYDRYLQLSPERPANAQDPPDIEIAETGPFDLKVAVNDLTSRIKALGYIFEPWQLAAYVAAIRTKPFVILAGITGTGKSTLPRLVADSTGGRCEIVPVRPDWTDSSDVLGYRDLQGIFRPGTVLQAAREASQEPNKYWTCVLDEMNLARVEQYLAELLSRIEQRHALASGGYASLPLLASGQAPDEWARVAIPPNLAIVGTVNMDESAHGFSRKVLDRAFTLELSEIDLTRWDVDTKQDVFPEPRVWPVQSWHPRARELGRLRAADAEDRRDIVRTVEALSEINKFLVQAQLQVGYRTRDEVALFVLHSREFQEAFTTSAGESVDPLDLALHMKVLPRIIGGSGPIRRAILQLLGWSGDGRPRDSEEDAQQLIDRWYAAGRPNALPNATFPRTAARLCLMWDRILSEGFTSFWL
jgi:hypothetical protein